MLENTKKKIPNQRNQPQPKYQLCRWLLLSRDRLQTDEIVMTQGLIANMLGVRREGVTAGALKLRRAGLDRYSRGHIVVLDRKALEKRTCECYAVVKREYERFPQSLPHRINLWRSTMASR